MTDKIRTSVDLGNGEEGRQRLSDLHKLAEKFGAVGQRGPSISNLLQMIADGEIKMVQEIQAEFGEWVQRGEVDGLDALISSLEPGDEFYLIESQNLRSQRPPQMVAQRQPGKTNQSGEVRLRGWLGTTNDRYRAAHGHWRVIQVVERRGDYWFTVLAEPLA